MVILSLAMWLPRPHARSGRRLRLVPCTAGGEHDHGAGHRDGDPSRRRALGKVMFVTGSAQVNLPRRYGG